jgi:hypothetical protein
MAVDDGTRTRGLCRDSVAWIGFTTTYKDAGTAKIPVSRTRHRRLWVGNFVPEGHRRVSLEGIESDSVRIARHPGRVAVLW